MRRWSSAAALVLLAFFVGCVPADEGLPLGSAQFTITARGSARVFDKDTKVGDGTIARDAESWTIRIDRFVVSFKTMTIVNLLNSDQCAYRGRGALSNILFDGTEGSVVQSFNGIKPGACPDVGLRLGAPDDRTVLGEGGKLEDLISLASGNPGIALVEATATLKGHPAVDEPNTNPVPATSDETMHLSLRFDAVRTSTAFGGCSDGVKGARIRPVARHALFVSFAAEVLFRDRFAPVIDNVELRFEPFAKADELGDGDKTITMDELDAMPLSAAGSRYQLPGGTQRGSFGDYVRAQFQFAVKFGNGHCNGIEPGTELDP
jgi:hypothetical protein